MIALIDYGAGNLTSVRKALAAVGAQFRTPASPSDLDDVEGVIVPGVGNFQQTSVLDQEWRDAIIGVGRARTAAARHLPWPAMALRGKQRGSRLPGTLADERPVRTAQARMAV
jgi:hypothetical protein